MSYGIVAHIATLYTAIVASHTQL